MIIPIKHAHKLKFIRIFHSDAILIIYMGIDLLFRQKRSSGGVYFPPGKAVDEIFLYPFVWGHYFAKNKLTNTMKLMQILLAE